MVLTVILIVLALSAIATVAMGIFMLMDIGNKEGGDDLASKITKAVDVTAKANGLWTRKQKISALAFLAAVIIGAMLAIYFLQRARGQWTWCDHAKVAH